MIMNNMIDVDTTSAIAKVERDFGHSNGGKIALHSIKFKDFKIIVSENVKEPICIGYLCVGDLSIRIFFYDVMEFIEFCEKHSIDFKDKRAQKLIEAAL